MRIEYDHEADALYIRFLNVKPSDSVDIEEGFTVDLDHNRHVVGIEILDASRRFPKETLSTVTIENLLPQPSP